MNDQTKIQGVRKILLKDWDPFCIGDNPHLINEYDEFIVGIVTLLSKHCNENALNNYLKNIEDKLDAAILDSQREKVVKQLLSVE